MYKKNYYFDLRSKYFITTCIIFLLFSFTHFSYAYTYVIDRNSCNIQNNSHQAKISFIKRLYADYVFGDKDFSTIAHKYCTRKLRKRLIDAYEYDCYEEECYAVWLFRLDVQDGPNNVCKINSIEELNDGWFIVNITDMGNVGSMKIKFIDCNGSFKMDELYVIQQM